MEAAAEIMVEHPLVEHNMGIQNDYGVVVDTVRNKQVNPLTFRDPLAYLGRN